MFHVTSDFVELNPAFRDFDERTNKVAEVMKQFRADNVFLTLQGWRDEVCTGFLLYKHFISALIYFLRAFLSVFSTASSFVFIVFRRKNRVL